MSTLLVICFYGIIAGCVYSVLHFFVSITNKKNFMYIICDTISSIGAGLIFIYCIINETSGIIRLYTICAFLFGILIVNISVGNLLDFWATNIYNRIAIVKTNLQQKQKNKKEKRNDTRATKPTG